MWSIFTHPGKTFLSKICRSISVRVEWHCSLKDATYRGCIAFQPYVYSSRYILCVNDSKLEGIPDVFWGDSGSVIVNVLPIPGELSTPIEPP